MILKITIINLFDADTATSQIEINPEVKAFVPFVTMDLAIAYTEEISAIEELVILSTIVNSKVQTE